MTIMSDDPLEIEEERRLAYVGITRAKDDLTLTCARQRMIRGETQYNPVSRFVKEIPVELLDNRPLGTKKRDYEEYREDSYERASFKAKPYDTDGGYRRSKDSATVYHSRFGKDADTIFDKPKPKAVVVVKHTAPEDQPFIVRSVQAAGRADAETAGNGGLSYGVGDRVRHLKYGEGTVMKLEPGPRDTQVTVVFDEMGQKIMYAGFAKLKKV